MGILRLEIALVVLAGLFVSKANAQPFTQIHDPVRGVSFFSQEINSTDFGDLAQGTESFDQTEAMTLGVSALLFEQTGEIKGYTIWLRREGPRKWISQNYRTNMTLMINGTPIELEATRTNSRSLKMVERQYTEKLDIVLPTSQFLEMLSANEVTLQVNTMLGSFSRSIADDEIRRLDDFYQDVKEQQQLDARTAQTPVSVAP